MKKKIPVPGATGAMGCYLVPELLSMGYAVDGVTPDHAVSDHPDLRYILTDASKNENLFPLLQNEYAGIVDFLIYSDPAKTFLPRRDKLLESTGHYLFLSSYRVYADKDAVTTEESPRRHLFQPPFSAGDAGSPDVHSPHMGKENRSFAERSAFGSAARRRAAFPEKRDV